MLDVLRRGEREVVETVVIFPSISSKKDQVSSLNEKGVKVAVWDQKVLTRKLRKFLKVNTKSVVV